MTQADDHQVPLDVVSVQLGEDACTATHVYRDAAGEMVRMPALQIVADTGCTCQACKHTWGPELFLHLARVLGFDTPEGVLD